MGKTTLVTGANGHLGNNLVKALLERGYTGGVPRYAMPPIVQGRSYCRSRTSNCSAWTCATRSASRRGCEQVEAEREAWRIATAEGGRFAIIDDEQPSFLEIARVMHGIEPKSVVTSEFMASTRDRRSAVSNARARREPGWKPEMPLERSLADTIAVLRELRHSSPW